MTWLMACKVHHIVYTTRRRLWQALLSWSYVAHCTTIMRVRWLCCGFVYENIIYSTQNIATKGSTNNVYRNVSSFPQHLNHFSTSIYLLIIVLQITFSRIIHREVSAAAVYRVDTLSMNNSSTVYTLC